jgi:soluble lytic murein transglycosylase-like protein
MPKAHVIDEVYGQAQKIQKHIQKRSKLSTSAAKDVTYSIIYESRRNNLEPELVTALIDTESEFNPLARSPKGACGIMQLMPVIWNTYGEGDVWAWHDNLAAGCKYLADLKRRFRDDYVTLCAYNAGPSRKRAEVIRLAGNYPGKVNRCRGRLMRQ